MRCISIDELPQLFNVLKCDMSLMGPRPQAAAYNTEYQQIIGNYAFRHYVRPGITGCAQVNGFRGETGRLELMEKRVDYDPWHINNWSLGLDIAILKLSCKLRPRVDRGAAKSIGPGRGRILAGRLMSPGWFVL